MVRKSLCQANGVCSRYQAWPCNRAVTDGIDQLMHINLRVFSPQRSGYAAARLRGVRLKPCVSCAKANMLANALLTASDVGNAF